jgi:hypothetical protein
MNPQTNQPPNTNLLIKRMNDFYRRHDHYRVLATPPDALWRQIAARYPSSNASAFEAITANEDILCETRPTYVVRAQYVAQYPEFFGKDAQGRLRWRDDLPLSL